MKVKVAPGLLEYPTIWSFNAIKIMCSLCDCNLRPENSLPAAAAAVKSEILRQITLDLKCVPLFKLTRLHNPGKNYDVREWGDKLWHEHQTLVESNFFQQHPTTRGPFGANELCADLSISSPHCSSIPLYFMGRRTIVLPRIVYGRREAIERTCGGKEGKLLCECSWVAVAAAPVEGQVVFLSAFPLILRPEDMYVQRKLLWAFL